MKGVKLLRIAGTGVLALIALAGSMIAIETVQTRRKVERLLGEIRALKVGDSNLDKLCQLVERYNGSVRDGAKCKTSTCTMKISITNESLSKYHLAPWSGFGVEFIIKQGRTVHLGLELWSNARGMSYYYKRLVSGQETGFGCFAGVLDDSADSDSYHTGSESFVRKGPDRIIVRLTPTDAAMRKKAQEFNLGCLSKLGGCRTPKEILPALYENDTLPSLTPETP